MKFFQKFSPQVKVLKEATSAFNGKIKVVESFGEKKILAGDLIQSGGVLRDIWKKGLKRVAANQPPIHRVLILGLGGGTAVYLVAQRWPKAEIVGVEIDPVMVRLGKAYFGIDRLTQLNVVNADAVDWVKQAVKSQEKFDLILVDLYCGDQAPPKTQKPLFWQQLKTLLGSSGIVIFNKLFYDHYRLKTENFVKKIGMYFRKVELIHAWSNLLVIARR